MYLLEGMEWFFPLKEAHFCLCLLQVSTSLRNSWAWWETGAMCERRYYVGEQWCNLRPDALAEYRAGQKQFRFWLE